MSLTTAWARKRTPAPPGAFDPWGDHEVKGALTDSLLHAGLEALGRAVARSGRDREAAFFLLEADGYVTYACEAATEEAGTEEVLTGILRRVGSWHP